jgi:tetratricopeptide (TPR) repeat protein
MFVGKVTWMVGAVAREALATHAGVDPVIPLMPPRLVQLLSRCFEPLPEQRPATMLEVATELQAIYAHTLGYAYSRTYPPLADLETGELIVQGIALDILGKSQEALALYEQAEHLDPEDATAHHNRGLALLQLGRFEEALAAYVQAIHLYEAASSEGKRFAPAEDISLAYEQKGLVLRRLGRAEEALVAYEQALSLNPVGTAFHNNRGNVLLDLGRKAEALDAFDEAVRLDPSFAQYWRTMLR